MKTIHFSHANGFPASSYEYFFSFLKYNPIKHIETMGHSSYQNKKNLGFLADELIDHIKHNHQHPLIGIGHSSGAAATLLAAAKCPELFEQIILIDPVTLGSKKRFAIDLARKLKLWNRIGPSNKARRRRANFANREQAFNYYQQKALFKNFHPHCFKSYIKHGLKKTNKGLQLTFSPDVEADIFTHVTTTIPKDLSNVKCTIIYADKSNVLGQSDINWWLKNHPHVNLIRFDGYHLFPFEQPKQTAELINLLLKS